MPQPYRRQILDHLGLVAGMFDELGSADVIDQATKQHPETRIVTVGHAVKAMVLNGLGFVNQRLYLVPMFFRNKPTHRLVAPGIEAQHLNDDTLGRALDTLYDYGVTTLYSLMATTAAQRLGVRPTVAHLDSTSFHVDGHDNSAEEPDAHVIHIIRGYSRDHRADLNHVMLDLIVEHQAGIPLLMPPLSGHTSDAIDFRHVVTEHLAPWHTTYGTAYLVADSALYNEDNLQQLAHTRSTWITRVPATLSEAQAALARADPETMAPLMEGYRHHILASAYGGVAQRWVLIDSEHRRPQAQRTVEKHLLLQSAAEVTAFKKLGRTTFACEADAPQALATFAQGLQATRLHEVTIRPTRCYAKRGRPGKATVPDARGYHIEGALTSSLAVRDALVAQHSCFLLATNELDERALSPQALLAGYKGQKHAERGFRFLKDPLFLASSLYLKNPQRIMALLMVMTVCLLVYAALEYRIRKALKTQQATCPDQKGQLIQDPTARWIFQYFVGIHLLLMPGEWPLVLNLTQTHQHLLQLLGQPYEAFYS
jgi:transposase